MSTDRTPRASAHLPPHDLEAEVALLGCLLLLSPGEIGGILRDVLPEDFYRAAHQTIYVAMGECHRAGERVDPVTVADRLRRKGLLDDVGGIDAIMNLWNATPAVSNSRRYSTIVQDLASRRRVIMTAAEISTMAADAAAAYDARECLDRAKSMLAGIAPARSVVPKDLTTVEDFAAHAEENTAPWLIPGIMRIGHRAIVVAPEGLGKGVLLRQIALCLSQGVHPFDTTVPITHRRTLYVDLENPPEVVAHHIALTRPVLERTNGRWRSGQAWILARESGMDLRSRAPQAELEATIAEVRPSCVVLGPVYKAFRRRGAEDWATAAYDAIEFLDDLRVRYKFGVLLEAHAAKGSNGHRDMDPAGAQQWMAWPEFGLALTPAGPKGARASVLKVSGFRGNRLPAAWPTELHRRSSLELTSLPWVGRWEEGDKSAAAIAKNGPTTDPARIGPAPDVEPF